MTDWLGQAAACGAESAGANVQAVRPCASQIQPCRGCGTCLGNGGVCLLEPDEANTLFSAMQAASALLFAVPVYFYGLPGQFKIFIDRSQKFWHCQLEEVCQPKPAAVIMAAARKRGEKLFAGSLLTLKWFLKPFGFAIANTLLLRGLERRADVTAPDLAAARALGVALAKAGMECAP